MADAQRQIGTSASAGRPAGRRRALTLTELLVTIAILVVVLVAVSRIFATASAVTGTGEATADLLQEAAVIEQQLRHDIAALAPGGLLAIRCVAVANDVNGDVLLNPNLPRSARIRADQLLYFTQGVTSVQTAAFRKGSAHQGQGTVSRVYFGHAFQLPNARPFALRNRTNPDVGAMTDADPAATVTPWTVGRVPMVSTLVSTMEAADGPDGTGIYRPSRTSDLRTGPIDARRWLLARQPVALVDDDDAAADANAKTIFLGDAYLGFATSGVQSARSVLLDDPLAGPCPQIRDGRMDVVASQLNDVRRLVQLDRAAPRPWAEGGDDQWSVIADELLYYPRAERSPPGMSRLDQALSSHVLGAACSGIRIEWTYRDGTGSLGRPGAEGLRLDDGGEQPWFGLEDEARSVWPLNVHPRVAGIDPPLYTQSVERFDPPGTVPVERYEAFFGFNRDEPVDAAGRPHPSLGYTPWPAALRITLTLHDKSTTLVEGRQVQFILDLPGRVRFTAR